MIYSTQGRRCSLMSLSPATVRIWSPQLPPQKQIHNFFFLLLLLLGSNIIDRLSLSLSCCLFKLISRFDENRLGGRSRQRNFFFFFFLFDSWIVNHINLLSYRHSGVCGDLCGFNYMALLTCNVILYMNLYLMF